MWLISNWKAVVPAIISAVVVSFAAYIMLTIQAGNQRRALEDQKTQLIAQCQKAQQVTENANAKLEQDRDAISKRLNALLVQHPAKCLYIASDTHKASSGTQYAGRDGVDSSALRRYAATCESYRSELLTYIDFVDKERQ